MNFVNGFAIADNEVLRDGRLSRDARCLYACLCGYADSDRKCYPSVATLCKNLNCGEKSFRKYRAELEKYGYLLIQARTGEKGQLSNMYILQDTAPENRTGGGQYDTPVKEAAPAEQTSQPPAQKPPSPPVKLTGQTVPVNKTIEQDQRYIATTAASVCLILNKNRQIKGGAAGKGRVKAGTGERFIRRILEEGHTAEEIIRAAQEGKVMDWWKLEATILGG